MGDLLEKVPIPKDDDPKLETWEAENSMIMPWLLHSMQPKISKSLLFLSTAKEIWEVMTFIFKGGDKGSSLWLKELNSLYEAMVVICDGVLWYARRLMTRTGSLST